MNYNAREELGMSLKTLMASGSQRNELIEKYYSRDLPVTYDGQQMQKKELMRSETLDGAAVIREDIVKAINEGARPSMNNIADLYYVVNTGSNSVKIPRGTKGSFGSYATIGEEGVGVTVDNNRLLKTNINIIKPMSTVEITREMIQDAEVDIISREIAAAGARIGNTMESVCLKALIDAAEASTETISSAATFKKAVNKEIANVTDNGYVVDRILLTPQAQCLLREDILNSYYEGNEQQTKSMIPMLYGIPIYTTSIKPATINTTTGAITPGAGTFGGTNGVGAVVYAKDKAVAVAIRDAVGTDTPFKDVYKDLTAITATCRFGASKLHFKDTVNDDVEAARYISY